MSNKKEEKRKDEKKGEKKGKIKWKKEIIVAIDEIFVKPPN